MLQQEIQTGLKQIQSRFTLAWDEINNSRRFIGEAKASQMQQQLHAKAKQEVLQYNQRAQQQLAQLQNIDRLAQQGLINNPDEIKMRMYNPDVAKQMYPTPEKGRTPGAVMGELDRYGEILQQRLDRYKSVRIPERWKREAQEKRKIQFYDYSLPAKKKGEVGAWRDATEEEIQIRDFYQTEQEEVEKRRTEIITIPGIKHRIVQPGTTGGSFSDKVAESYKKPVRQRPGPTRQEPIRQQPEAVPEPKTEAEYNALPPGTRYKHPSGNIRTKK